MNIENREAATISPLDDQPAVNVYEVVKVLSQLFLYGV